MSAIFVYSSLGYSQNLKSEENLEILGKIQIAYLTSKEVGVFEKEVIPFFNQQTQCKKCELIYFQVPLKPITSDFDKIFLALGPAVRVVFFDFNIKSSVNLKPAIAKISELFQAGKILIATAGEPIPGDPSLPLHKTLWGEVEHVLILGEISDRDRLLPMSYFGPEIYTAIRPPKEFYGQRRGPLFFTAKFAHLIEKRTAQEWWQFFKEKKLRNKHLWIEISDLF